MEFLVGALEGTPLAFHSEMLSQRIYKTFDAQQKLNRVSLWEEVMESQKG